MSELININSKSFKKMIFHSLKFLTNDTIGILVGSLQENKIFLVEDVYPLTHLRVTLPFLETAISLVINLLKFNIYRFKLISITISRSLVFMNQLPMTMLIFNLIKFQKLLLILHFLFLIKINKMLLLSN
jgi:hypothetical protein